MALHGDRERFIVPDFELYGRRNQLYAIQRHVLRKRRISTFSPRLPIGRFPGSVAQAEWIGEEWLSRQWGLTVECQVIALCGGESG